jgi:hypothetical protein
MQSQLIQLAFDEPDFQRTWIGGDDNGIADHKQWRQFAYTNLIFRYLQFGFDISAISEPGLDRTLRNRFQSAGGRQFWETSRGSYALGAVGRRQRRFHQIADSAYRRTQSDVPRKDLPCERAEESGASGSAGMPRIPATIPRDLRYVAVMAAGAVGLAISIQQLRRCRTRSTA